MSDRVLGWHWLLNNGCLRLPPYSKVEVGQTLTAEGPLELCNNGMHASRRALDALQYAFGPIVCRVELSGEIVEGDDQLCARHRKVLAMADATEVLHEFACRCAEEGLLRECALGWRPDKRSWAAIETKRKWLKGEATDEELCAASVAADAAANATSRTAGRAACAAASDAASAVAIDAAWYASWSAARSAAWSAARNDTWESVWVVARDVQNAKLEEMLNALLEGVAYTRKRLLEELLEERREPRGKVDTE
jgi:hypothetical protein